AGRADLRRAGFRTRCVDPGPDPQSSEGSAEGAWPDLPVHFAQSRRCRLHRRPDCGDVRWPPGGDRAAGRAFLQPCPSLHPGASVRGAEAGSGQPSGPALPDGRKGVRPHGLAPSLHNRQCGPAAYGRNRRRTLRARRRECRPSGTCRMKSVIALISAILPLIALPAAQAQTELQEIPALTAEVAAGRLPPVDQRLPAEPLRVAFTAPAEAGRHGGEIRTLIGRARARRLLSVIAYPRRVVYNEKFEIVPDLVESYTVEDERVFTFRLRQGHRWSDGQPFTTEDFRYYWEDVANNKDLSPSGPPIALLVDGDPPQVTFPDPHTVRYEWSKRNPYFLPRLAGAAPLYIYRPAHYMKKFHARYADPAELQRVVTAAKQRNWAALHNRLDNMYESDNPDLPSLDPWVIATRPPAIRFLAQRNPFYHRVDPNGLQLPYLDRIVLTQADGKLIPAKAGAGEADLQFRTISFNNFTFLKENEKRAGYKT